MVEMPAKVRTGEIEARLLLMPPASRSGRTVYNISLSMGVDDVHGRGFRFGIVLGGGHFSYGSFVCFAFHGFRSVLGCGVSEMRVWGL